MNNQSPFSLILILTILSQDPAKSRADTNILSGEVRMLSVRATAIEERASEKSAKIMQRSMIWTNGVPFDNGQPQVGSMSQEIQLTEAGCEGTWGRHKALFDADIASEQPVRVTMPDGKKIAFRPTFLVLANRATGQQLLIAEITNRIAQIIQPGRVVWTNAFDRSGPEIDVEYNYTAAGVEQNIVFRENPLKNLPAEWKLADVAIECWTEAFFDSAPATIESKTAQIRAELGAEKGLVAEDQDIGWNSMKIVAGGRAFSVAPISKAQSGTKPGSDDEQDSLPVSKIWTEIEDGGRKRTFIIETLDAMGAKPKLDGLKEGRHASATKPASGRSEFLRLHASLEHLRRDGRQASTVPPNQGSVAMGERAYILGKLKGDSIKPGFVLDFAFVNTVPVPPGIVSWWPAGGNALDAITNHNDGYLSNGVTYASGKVGQGFTFGAYSNYVKIPNSVSLNPTNALTIDCWVYLDKYGSNHMLVGKDNQVNQRQYALTVSPGKTFRACIGITNGTFYYIDSAALAATGVWTHVAMTYSAANSNLSFYLNGHLDTNGTVVGSAISTTEPLFIGNAPRGSPYWWSYDPPGRIDEVDIFNRALSASEIQSIYDAGAAGKYNPNCVTPSTNIVAWWPAEGNSYDIAGTNFAYPFNGPSYAAGAVRSGFSFDGVNDYLVASNTPSLNPTNALTLEAWVYLNSWDPINWPNGNYPIISKDGCDHDRQYLLTVDGNQKFCACIGTVNSSCYQNFCFGDGRTTVQPGGWYHVAMTYDTATSKLILYVDGAEDLTLTNILGPIISTSEPVFIGGAPHSCFPYYFPGLIDEPTIYNRALSATEISTIYSAGTAGKCACYVTNQTYTCVSPATVLFQPITVTNTFLCAGDLISGSVTTTSLNGILRQTLDYSDCNSTYTDSSFAPAIQTNWFVLTAPDGACTSGGGLSALLSSGMQGDYTLTFYSQYTNSVPPCTNAQIVSITTNFTAVAVEDLYVQDITPVADDGITKTYIICLQPTNSLWTNVVISAIADPDLDQSNLPPCWALSGGIGTSKLSRTVDITQLGTSVLVCDSGSFSLTNIIIVANSFDNDYDGVPDCQELMDGTDPQDPASVNSVLLGRWRFDDTNSWAGDQGQLPLLFTNLTAAPSWSTDSVQLDNTNIASLVYRDVEPSGYANINCQAGTIRFWFKPNWNSASTNSGTGPQSEGRLIEMGNQTPTNGWWSLFFSSNGTSVRLITQTNGTAMTNLTAMINWTSNDWHQVTLTYDRSNCAIYVDGISNSSGSGIQYLPKAVERATGFSIGSDKTGHRQARGRFDELETFNYIMDSQSILAAYQQSANLDSDGDGLSNLRELQLGTDPFNWDTDGDLLSDGDEVNIYHTDPLQADSDHDGMPDGWEVLYHLTPNNAADASGDLDNDGFTNLAEYQLGTDPTRSDTDGDGFSDGYEVQHNMNPLVWNDPKLDSDYDGRSDAQEFADGTDPLDANSVLNVRIGYWRFDTTNWIGDAGQWPLSFTNLQITASWSSNAVIINNTNSARLTYREAETNGAVNINCRRGSVRFWFKPYWSSSTTNSGTGPQAQARLFEMGSQTSSNGFWALLLNPNGTNISFVTQTNGVGTTNFSTAINWRSNEWHQIVLTYCVTNSSLYLDGQAAISNGAGVLNYASAQERALGLNIGSDKDGGRQAKGTFEEFETFNYQISSTNIGSTYTQIINSPFFDKDNDGVANYEDAQPSDPTIGRSIVSPAGLISWWPADGNANDLVGTNNGSAQSGVTYVSGKISQAFGFNGTNSFVIVPNSSELNPGSAITVEGWIYPRQYRDYEDQDLISKDGETTERAYLIQFTSDNTIAAIIWTTNGVFYAAGSATLQTNTWYHVALTYDGGTLKAYVNGQLEGNTSATGLILSNSQPVRIGGGAVPGAPQQFFNGMIDESAIYSRALSAPEILAIYTAGAGGKYKDTDYDGRSDAQELGDGTSSTNPLSVTNVQLAQFQFDSPAFLGTRDQSPLLSSNLIAVPSWNAHGNAAQVENRTNSAVLKYRDVESNGLANINLRSGTVRFWFKPDWRTSTNAGAGPQSLARLLEVGDQNSANGWWALLVNSNGTQISFQTATNSSAATNLTGSFTWWSNMWHQVVLTYCPTNTSLYIDGQPLQTVGSGVQHYPNAASRAAGFSIGSDKNGNNQARGVFDELQTYNYPLSAAAISNDFAVIAIVDTDGDGLTDIQEAYLETNPLSTDTDGNGQPDGDEDFDHDLLSNRAEFTKYKTDPLNPNSINTLDDARVRLGGASPGDIRSDLPLSITSSNATNVTLRLDGTIPGHQYLLLSTQSTNLTDWQYEQMLPGTTNQTNTTFSVALNGRNPLYFVAGSGADPDGDQLPDLYEVVETHTSPDVARTDPLGPGDAQAPAPNGLPNYDNYAEYQLITVYPSVRVCTEAGSFGEFTIMIPVGYINNGTTVNFNVAPNDGSICQVISPTSVFIAAGSYSARVLVKPINDSTFTTGSGNTVPGSKNVVLTLTGSSDFTVSDVPATVTIMDDDLPNNVYPATYHPKVSVKATNPYATEYSSAHRAGVFSISRSDDVSDPNDLKQPLTVYFRLSGTAKFGLPGGNGVDYGISSPDASEFSAQSITIPSSSVSANLLINPVDDSVSELPETVILTLLPNQHYDLSTPLNTIRATVSIDNDDTRGPPYYTLSVLNPDAAVLPITNGIFVITRFGSTNAPKANPPNIHIHIDDPNHTADHTVSGVATFGNNNNLPTWYDYTVARREDAQPGPWHIAVQDLASSAPDFAFEQGTSTNQFLIKPKVTGANLDGPETVTLSAITDSADLGSGVVTIWPQRLPLALSIPSGRDIATEGSTKAQFQIQRVGAGPWSPAVTWGEIKVYFELLGQADPDSDYTVSSTEISILYPVSLHRESGTIWSVVIPSDQAKSETVNITAINDSLPEGVESLIVKILPSDYVIGRVPPMWALRIRDAGGSTTFIPDTDNDGTDDKTEISNGTDPLVPDSNLPGIPTVYPADMFKDSDRDGINNITEYLLNSIKTDGDLDLISDFAETSSDPTVKGPKTTDATAPGITLTTPTTAKVRKLP